jgi:hypothetical protein
MLAFDMFVNTRDGYRIEWQDARRRERDKLGKGHNPYETIKRQMGL